jgi:hypothetical protein
MPFTVHYRFARSKQGRTTTGEQRDERGCNDSDIFEHSISAKIIWTDWGIDNLYNNQPNEDTSRDNG